MVMCLGVNLFLPLCCAFNGSLQFVNTCLFSEKVFLYYFYDDFLYSIFPILFFWNFLCQDVGSYGLSSNLLVSLFPFHLLYSLSFFLLPSLPSSLPSYFLPSYFFPFFLSFLDTFLSPSFPLPFLPSLHFGRFTHLSVLYQIEQTWLLK